MPRTSREKDDTRSSPYDSSRDRGSRYRKHRDHRLDEDQYKTKELNRHEDKYQSGNVQKPVREYEGRRKNEDHSDTCNKESGRSYKYDGNGEKKQRRRSPSPSGYRSHNQGARRPNSPCGKSKRPSGFDVAPPVATSLSGNLGFISFHASKHIEEC